MVMITCEETGNEIDIKTGIQEKRKYQKLGTRERGNEKTVKWYNEKMIKERKGGKRW